PGVRLLSAKLPVLNQSLGANRRLLLVVAFSLAYLGACTVERWRTGSGPKRWVVLVSALVLLGVMAWGCFLSLDLKALLAVRGVGGVWGGEAARGGGRDGSRFLPNPPPRPLSRPPPPSLTWRGEEDRFEPILVFSLLSR